MAFWRRNKDTGKPPIPEEVERELRNLFLSTNIEQNPITREQAMDIPSVDFCTNFITKTIAGVEIKLYKEENGKIREVKDDIRTKLLNDETGDLLSGTQLKKAVIEDYLFNGSGHIYINKTGNTVKSLHYVEEREISIQENDDPIFKDVKINVRGYEYEAHRFINVTRKTVNGVTGKGIIEENNLILSTVYNSLRFENANMKAGGIKKGVIKSAKKLSEGALNELKRSWKKLYSKDSEENCIILNEGLDYKELQQTFVEMQLLENKKANGRECCKLFLIPPKFCEEEEAQGKGTIFDTTIKTAIIPVLNDFISAINQSLLLEKEKGSFYFAYEIKDLLKGDIEKRYKAYEVGIKNGFLTTNEVRYADRKSVV